MAEVSFVCKRTVVSTKAIQPGKFYSLSVLDHFMESSNLRIVYYYSFRPENKADGMMKKMLMASLSETLLSFPVMTGRLQKTPEGNWMIKCNDAGVRMIEARVKGSVDDWLQTVDREQELKLIYWEEMFHNPYFWSTFYVQLTEFEGGGIAIGLSCSHLLADATSATMLIKAWAHTFFNGKMLNPPHFHPLPPRRIGNKDVNHKPYRDLINYYKSFMNKNNPNSTTTTKSYATVTLVFTDEMVKKCMTDARVTGTVDCSSLTPFEALSALFWVVVSKVKGKKEGLMDMSVCLDMRIVLGLDKGFFGNCVVFNKVSGEGLKDGGLVKAAKAICEVVGKMDYEGIMDLVESLDSNKDGDKKSSHQSPPPPTPPPLNGPDLICANWETLDSYSAIFEPQIAPIRVSFYFEPVFGDGQVLILPSPYGEGSLSRAAMITLPEDQAVKVCEDALMLHYSPTILMGLKQNQA